MAYSNYNIIYRLQKWIDSVAGQTFLNYAYSWGASIVILGTLFKLTHLPGANLMLYIGMGTEVIVFFISAFDRPFDKTADGLDLAKNGNPTPKVEIPTDTPENNNRAKVNDTLEEMQMVYLQQMQTNYDILKNLQETSNQSKDLASKIAELNHIYGRVLNALQNKNQTVTEK